MTFVGFDVRQPAVREPCSLRVQTVLFETKPSDIEKSLASIARAAEIGIRLGRLAAVEVAYGDSSAVPVIEAQDIETYHRKFPALAGISYAHFGANLGSAGGQNRLLEDAKTDLVFFINPDIRFSPTAFAELVKPFLTPGVGITEARQLPLEHPKDYDRKTGETAWAAGACMMVPVGLAQALGGFDAESFFLYGDDVDLSWRVRLAGFKIIHQPSAGAFHDKRLTAEAMSSPGLTELYYSAEARLILAHKYDRPDLVKSALVRYEASDEAHLKQAAAAYRRRQSDGRLPSPIAAPGIAEFIGNNFAHHRYAL